jgi:hypothetical protein
MNTKNIVVPYARLQQVFQENPAQLAEAVYKSADSAAEGDSVERAQLIAAWNEAVAALQNADQGRVMSTAQNPIASRLQTLIAGKSAEARQTITTRNEHPVLTPQGDPSFTPGTLEVKFDSEDLIGWLGMAWKLIFKPDKAAWIDPPTAPQVVDDNARIAIFSDWGTGLYGAPAISKSIIALDRCDVALHLGDTYYSGADDEIEGRLVGDWPVRDAKTVSRSLNGNHEMYSGGSGYFNALRNFFKQSASCFAMQTSRWILVCLDTAYVDFDLDARQVAWLNSLLNAAGSRKLILFSHHQPFSLLDAQGPKLQVALAELLNKQRIHAWFWGHEHRLVLYDPHPTWGFKGRCVGNGGFPAFRDNLTSTPSQTYQWISVPAGGHAPGGKIFDGPNFWIPEDPMRYSPHGFLTLDFDGASVWETYYVPNKIAVTPRTRL